MRIFRWERSALIGLVLLCGAFATADNWPQWRGPNRDGVADADHLPTQWSPDTHVAWKAELAHLSIYGSVSSGPYMYPF